MKVNTGLDAAGNKPMWKGNELAEAVGQAAVDAHGVQHVSTAEIKLQGSYMLLAANRVQTWTSLTVVMLNCQVALGTAHT